MKRAKLPVAVVISIVAALAIGLMVKSDVHAPQDDRMPSQATQAKPVDPVYAAPLALKAAPTRPLTQITAEDASTENAPLPNDEVADKTQGGFSPDASRPPMPELRIKPDIGGEEAIAALGNNLEAVAAHYGKSRDELINLLRGDSTVRLDGRANLYYKENNFPDPPDKVQKVFVNQEKFGGEESVVVEKPPVAAQAIQPLSQTFLLHSKPGATKIILLDFDGQTVSGTAWNDSYNAGAPFVQAAWDSDGSPATFSDAEKTSIQQAWSDVADTFAPFDVDVTTQDPGQAVLTRSDSSDTQYGVRVVISHSNNALICPDGSGGITCSGIAYLNTFGQIGNSTPALVFSNYANGSPDDRSSRGLLKNPDSAHLI